MTVNVLEDGPPQFKKTSLVRVPIRLGQDVFTTGKIGDEKQAQMIETMRAYRLLMDVHQIEDYKACATSAMREAENTKQLCQEIFKESQIDIEVIDGDHEAAMIAMTDLHNLIQEGKTYLYVDVGGGSTEFTLYSDGRAVDSRSFKIGTVRLLNDMVKKQLWQEAQSWVEGVCRPHKKIELIGSGGNINNIYKSHNISNGKPMTFLHLSRYYDELQNYTYEERIYHLGKNHDRADVIIPASRIYLSAMKWSGAKNIYVPKIGLADGIIKSIYSKHYGKDKL